MSRILLRPLAAALMVLVSCAETRAEAPPANPSADAPPESASFAAVSAADDERIAAMLAGERGRLEAILSDGLHYAHSNGVIDTKSSLIESLVSRRAVYRSFEYAQRRFTPVAPGIVLMTGRALIRAGGPDQQNSLDLSFLAVWREEGGRWRFLAWQSSRHPPANTAPAAK